MSTLVGMSGSLEDPFFSASANESCRLIPPTVIITISNKPANTHHIVVELSSFLEPETTATSPPAGCTGAV